MSVLSRRRQATGSAAAFGTVLDTTPVTAGVRVSERSALTLSAVWRAVALIASDTATLPFPVFERLERGKRRASDHPVYALLNRDANEVMSAMTLRETLEAHRLVWGNGYAEIERDGGGLPVALWPLDPRSTTPVLRGRRLFYRVTLPERTVVLEPHQVFHVHGRTSDGVTGLSVIEHARQSLGVSIAAERFGGQFFANGSKPSGVLNYPGRLTPQGKENLAESWQKANSGLSNAERVAVLEEGTTWTQIGMPPGDAQFLETRQFGVVEVARWFGVPPHKLWDLGRATWGNIESLQIEYVTSGLLAELRRWETEAARKLFADDRYFAEHLVEGLLRGDVGSRFTAYATARQWGWLSANDVRELENMNPVPGGDAYLTPLNMVPSGGEPPRSGPAPRMRSTESRLRIAARFAPLIADADRRVAVEERRLVRDLLALVDAGQLSELADRLRALYGGRIAEVARTELGPVLAVFADAVASDAAADIAANAPDIARFVDDYTTSHLGYRLGSSPRRIAAAAERGADAVSALLDEMVADRPARTAGWETRQVPAAVSRHVWETSGVPAFVWRTRGDTCDYCTRLNGRVVSAGAPFATKGESLDGGEGAAPIQVARTTLHPPMHPGCDCVIEPAV